MHKFGTNMLHDMNTHTLSLFELFPSFFCISNKLFSICHFFPGQFSWLPWMEKGRLVFACCISYWNRVLEPVYAELTSRGLQTGPKKEALDRIKTLQIFST